MEKAFLNWSGGKDSGLTLYRCQQASTAVVQRLITTINRKYERISMHGVRVELLRQQAKALNLPLHEVYLEESIDMAQYDRIMAQTISELKSDGFTLSVYGDIFLDDLRKYREDKLRNSGVKALFPLWLEDTSELINEFISMGFKAVVVCADAHKLDQHYVGREINHSFIEDLPSGVDPCGENGEFHSFVYDGPIFNQPLKFRVGETVLREYPPQPSQSWSSKFWFCDLLPDQNEY